MVNLKLNFLILNESIRRFFLEINFFGLVHSAETEVPKLNFTIATENYHSAKNKYAKKFILATY